MAYLNRLDVDFEGCGPFVVHHIVQAKDFGRCTQDGFVAGWTRVAAESKGRVAAADWAGQKRFVRERTAHALADPAAFKQLYDYVFDLGREADKKALDMGMAVGFWAGLYNPASAHPWRSANVDWLEAWTNYLRERFGVETTDAEGNVEVTYKRTVSKDLWGQTRLFAAKTMEDETLAFWSEDQAWPGLIDEFVVWCQEKGISPKAKTCESMEVEE
jgi:DCN1-like protein 1/2